MVAVKAEDRFTRKHPCPVCGGADDDDRGKERRCYGYLDNASAICTRRPSNWPREGSNGWAHPLARNCPCGEDHQLPVLVADPTPRTVTPSTLAAPEAIYSYPRADGSEVVTLPTLALAAYEAGRPDAELACRVGDERFLMTVPAPNPAHLGDT